MKQPATPHSSTSKNSVVKIDKIYNESDIETVKQTASDNTIMVALCSEIARVRGREDLLAVINSQLRQLFYFSHSMIALIDSNSNTYSHFLIDPNSIGKGHPDYKNLLNEKFRADDEITKAVLKAEDPVIFSLKNLRLKRNLPPFVRINHNSGVQQMLCAALRDKGGNIGYITLFSDNEQTFDLREIALLKSFASLLATAVSNIVINAEIEKKEKEKSILLHISNEVASVRSKTDLFPIVNDHLKKLFSYDDGVICVLNDDKTSHSAFLYNPEEVFAKYPGCEQLAEMTFNRNDGIFDDIVFSNAVTVFELDEIIKLPNHSVYIPFWIQQGMTQLIGVPLTAGKKSLGSFSFYTKQRDPIPKENFELLLGICSQIAIAIENILTNENIEKREKEKSILLSFSNEIVTIRNREGLRSVFKRYLSRNFQINEYIITINNEDGKTYSYLLHDSPGENPTDKGFEIITGLEMPITGSLTGAVLGSEEPVIFNINEIKKNKTYSFPAASFWDNAGASQIKGMRLRAADKDIGILWTQPGRVNERLLKGVSAQIALAIANVIANEKIERHLQEISKYKVRLEQENNYLLDEIQGNYKYSEIIGAGEEMQKVYLLMSQVAFANSTVLLLGETGTGKELIARAIHNGSPRKNKIMVKVNCAALPANLIESELFGHERGSFTGATERRVGKFELAHNSTLFLDEIGEMPLDLQVKLLRALQEKEIERVGGKGTINVDVRIIAATNRDLQQEVAEGKFRRDLYYRLNVFPITLPPLRQRPEDIPLLTKHFIERLSRSTGKKITNIAQRALYELQTYNWPGNVRELEHLLERSILLTSGNTIKEIHLPVTDRKDAMNNVSNEFIKSLEDNERDYIIKVLKKCNGKVFGIGGAAERLNLPASTLNSKLIKLGIKREQLFTPTAQS